MSHEHEDCGIENCSVCRIAELESDLAEAKRGSEMGPCGKHPKMFWQVTQPPKAYQTPPVYGCTLCSDLTAAYERGLRDALAKAEEMFGQMPIFGKRVIALKDRGAKGGSE